jgi:hypothetical protein
MMNSIVEDKKYAKEIFSRDLIWVLLIFLIPSCQLWRRDPQNILTSLRQEVAAPLEPARAEEHLKRFQMDLPALVALEHEGNLGEAWAGVVCAAVAHYQFYYFIKPSHSRWELLKECYPLLDRYKDVWHPAQATATERTYRFSEIRSILESAWKRNEKAEYHAQKLLQFWQEYPDQCGEFLEKLRIPWELGGIISYNEREGISWRFIENTKHLQDIVYLAELKANRFEHLDILEQRFLSRLALQQVGTDEATQGYNRVVLSMARRCFANIRKLAVSSRPFSPQVLRELADNKANLQDLGLETKLLKNTYFMDKTPYLQNPDTAFFFHSHPYEPIPYYQGSPSGQDEEMSFRIGPCLVWAIQKDHVATYLVVMGTSTLIWKFREKTVAK